MVPFHTVSPIEGLTAALGKAAMVFYDRGLPTTSDLADATEFTTRTSDGTRGLTVEFYTNDQLAGPPETTTVVQHLNFKGVSSMRVRSLTGALKQSSGRSIPANSQSTSAIRSKTRLLPAAWS